MHIQEIVCNPDRRWHIHEKSERERKKRSRNKIRKKNNKNNRNIVLIEGNKATNFEKRISNL